MPTSQTEVITYGNSKAIYTQGDGFIKRRAWDKNGILRSSITRKTSNSKLHGKSMWFDAKGMLETVVHYKNNQPHGKHFTYINGILSSSENYKNGKLHGRCRMWSHGQLISDVNYKDGKRHGRLRRWSATGKLLEDRVY